MENGANVNAKCEVGFTPLIFALQYSNDKEAITYEVVEYLLKNNAIISQDVLLESCEYNNVSVVKLIVEYDNQDYVFNSGSLVVACDYNNLNVINYLINYGVDVNGEDGFGTTALMKASKFITQRNLSLIKLLIKNGADVTIKDQHGYTALDILKQNYNEEAEEEQNQIYHDMLGQLTGEESD